MESSSSTTLEIKEDLSDNNIKNQESSIAYSKNDVSYDGFPFNRSELTSIMRKTYDDVIAFVLTPSFKQFHKELYNLPAEDRPSFLASVLFNPLELERRGIHVPKDILIQRSAFRDRRPTLFAVKKFLLKKYHGAWENMNITFDNEYTDTEVSRDVEKSWRPPLPVGLQNTYLASDNDLESIPTENGIKVGIFEEKHKNDLKLAKS